jgi:hypothetical protein
MNTTKLSRLGRLFAVAPRGGARVSWLKSRVVEVAKRLSPFVTDAHLHHTTARPAPGHSYTASIDTPNDHGGWHLRAGSTGRDLSEALGGLLIDLHDKLAARCLADARALERTRLGTSSMKSDAAALLRTSQLRST